MAAGPPGSVRASSGPLQAAPVCAAVPCRLQSRSRARLGLIAVVEGARGAAQDVREAGRQQRVRHVRGHRSVGGQWKRRLQGSM